MGQGLLYNSRMVPSTIKEQGVRILAIGANGVVPFSWPEAATHPYLFADGSNLGERMPFAAEIMKVKRTSM